MGFEKESHREWVDSISNIFSEVLNPLDEQSDALGEKLKFLDIAFFLPMTNVPSILIHSRELSGAGFDKCKQGCFSQNLEVRAKRRCS